MTGQAGIVCSTCGADNRGPRSTCGQCGRALPPFQIVPGFVLASRYEIRETLGAGGMGVVFKAHDRLLNETVAIKVLRPEAAQAPEIAARFISEIKLARAVSHRNVARIHEYGEDQGVRYISMAFVNGVDLKRIVRERGPFPPARAFEIAIQAAEGLHAIHEEGIVHRDLKSSNIMLDGHGVVRLMDFGLAKLWSPGEPRDMTASGEIVGTPEYMSPEQILGRELDQTSDVYSLGVVFYELLTGRTPFRGDTPIATLMMHLNDPAPLDDPSAERVPRSVTPLLRRALSKQPGERFPTALEFARALERARAAWLAARDDSVATVSLTPTAVPSVTVAARTPAPGSRRRRVALGAAVALAAALGGFLLFGSLHRGGGRVTAEPASATSPARSESAGAATVPTPTESRAVASLPPTLPVESRTATTKASPRSDRSLASPQRPATQAPGAAPSENGPASHAVEGTANPPGAEPRLEGQLESLLADAASAFEAQRYDEAIALYDQVLRLDPRQQMARIARATAVNAKTAARAPAAAAPERGRAFVAGRTTATAADAGPERAYADAFEAGSGVDVRSDTPVSHAPGRIEFVAKPDTPRAGDHYTLQIYFANPAKAPVEIREMRITHSVDGRRSSGAVAPSARTVAPEQTALLLSLSDFLAEGTESWSLEVRVTTAGGETYRNEVTWK